MQDGVSALQLPTQPRHVRMPSMPVRSRGWVFTINNYGPTDLARLKRLECKYIVYGFERGESGTPHLQGFVSFHNQRPRRAVSADLGRAYCAPQRGTAEQAISYCKKDGDFIERGTPPKSQKQKGESGAAAWRNINEAAKAGNFAWIEDKYPKIWILHNTNLRQLYKPTTHPIDGELEHEWWVGPTGTGKSRTVWELYPNHYQKSLNKWWDGYVDEDYVVIEEWSPKNEVSGSQLKVWADRYPFPGQIKGGTLQKIRPKKIIVLSNYTIGECFTDPQDREPLYRRFKTFMFPDDMQKIKERVPPTTPESSEAVEVPDLSDLYTLQVDTDESSLGADDDIPPLPERLQRQLAEDEDIMAYLNSIV